MIAGYQQSAALGAKSGNAGTIRGAQSVADVDGKQPHFVKAALIKSREHRIRLSTIFPVACGDFEHRRPVCIFLGAQELPEKAEAGNGPVISARRDGRLQKHLDWGGSHGLIITPAICAIACETMCGMEVRLDTSLELLLERAPAAHASRVLATVVATAGSTYRKPGARMLLMADGSYIGLLSGGCLESDLQIHARDVLDRGVARAVEYDTRGPDDTLFGVGAGCEGTMRVLLEPAGPASAAERALAAAGRLTQSGEATSLVMVHNSTHLPLGTHHGGEELPAAELNGAYTQHLAPPPHLLVCGATPDAQPVVSAARNLGWRVSVVDHRPAYAVPARFPGAEVHVASPKSLRGQIDLARCHAAVVMSHHLPSDEVYLRELAQASIPAYIGLLGPKARRGRLLQELGPLTDKLTARLRSPVGLDIGAATPEGIALSIIGQIHAWLAGRAYSEAVLT